jgi:hypothetical protein
MKEEHHYIVNKAKIDNINNIFGVERNMFLRAEKIAEYRKPMYACACV